MEERVQREKSNRHKETEEHRQSELQKLEEHMTSEAAKGDQVIACHYDAHVSSLEMCTMFSLHAQRSTASQSSRRARNI